MDTTDISNTCWFSFKREADCFDLLIHLILEHVNICTLLLGLQDFVAKRGLRLFQSLRQKLPVCDLLRKF